MCLIRSLGALSLNNTKKRTVIITIIWRCHTASNSLDSILCSNLLPAVLLAYRQSKDKASWPWLLKHPILAALQSFLSSCISLSLNSCFGNCNIVKNSARFIANCCQGGCGQTPTLYLADTSAVQSTRFWGIIKVLIMLLFSKSSEILSLNLLLQM